MSYPRWLKNNGLLVALAVLLVTASATTISVARRLGAATSLRQRTEQLGQRLTSQDAPDATRDDTGTSNGDNGGDNRREATVDPPARVLAQRIDARHLFTAPPSPQFRNVIGVLGNRALYPGGDSLAVGEQREGATLKAVGADYVEFEFEGETVRVDVLAAGGDAGGGGPQFSGSRRGGGGGGQFGRGGGARGSGGPGSPSGGFDREAMRSRFESMSPEEREAAIARFREQRGGGGGERRGERGGNNSGGGNVGRNNN